jgi:shikimate 5-dehydrogenase
MPGYVWQRGVKSLRDMQIFDAGRMYFLGVTTASSAIHRMFPLWCGIAGVAGAVLEGVDLAVGAPPESYRKAVQRMRDDPDCRGALVTTHKVAVVAHAGDLIDELDHDARELVEVSCLVRRGGELSGSALDVECSAWALSRVVPAEEMSGREVLILGAGGAGTALAVALGRKFPQCRATATDVNPDRLEHLGRLSGARLVPVATPAETDALLESMGAGAIVVNATGMGKDVPGSPITPAARFPKESVAWELNYRGDLKFLEYARANGIRTVDGWEYFVRGWGTVMSRVLGFELTEERMEAFRDAAAAERWGEATRI